MNSRAILGAIIAGGKARRFGSDKALALLDGRRLIDHVVDDLSRQVDHIVICGRGWHDLTSIDDRPAAGQGPLAGLCAALAYARERGYSYVVSAPVDVHPFPGDIVRRLIARSPCVLDDQFLIGAWPVALADALDDHLRAGHRSIRSWIARAGATSVRHPCTLTNINFRRDWEGLISPGICSEPSMIAPHQSLPMPGSP